MTVCSTCGEPLLAGEEDCPRCVTRLDSSAPTEDGSPPAPRPSGPARIAHFKIVRELGAGGMGVVYLARDERMNRDVALKVLSRAHGSEKASRRFEQEAWIAGRLDHPNLVKVHERGTWDGVSYFSMELVDGGSLADVIDAMRRAGRDDGLDLEFGSSRYVHWAIRTVIDAALGLDYAHRQGVVHRDVKPMNLLINRKLGMVKIADFGLALDAEAARMTSVGAVMGTVFFMAPEQIRGESDRIDARTDVYALGVTLFELLTLELPYVGHTQQIYMSQVLTSQARRARKLNARVSRDLETVILKSMEKDQKDRYASAAAFAQDLDNVLHLRPITAKPEGRWRRATKWVRRKPVHATLAATLAIALPAAGVAGARVLAERQAARLVRLADLLDEARWLGERKRYADMADRAEAALRLDPGNPLALRHRAMARFLGATSEASDARKQAVREEALAEVAQVVAALPNAAWPHALRAYMLETIGRPQEAATEAETAASLRAATPSDEDVSEEARLAQARGDQKGAIELYSELIRRQPDSVRAISSRALIHEEMKDPERAFVDYRVAAGIDPSYDLTLIDLARMSQDRGELDDASTYLARALAIDPDSAFALEARGRLLMDRGLQAKNRGEVAQAAKLFEDAEAATRAALARSDDLVWAELNLAAILGERAKMSDEPDPALMARAVEGYQKVLDGFATPPADGQERDVYDAALMNTCDAQIAMRRLQEALATCSRVAELQPKSAVASYNLAGVHALLGQDGEAIAHLSRDVELGDRDWEYLAADTWFERLRGDPRFDAILAKMKHPTDHPRPVRPEGSK